jgi:hypothetical protein
VPNLLTRPLYATTGVVLDELDVRDHSLRIRVRPENGVNYKIEFVGASEQDTQARVLKSVEGPEGSIELLESYVFVRAKVISDKVKENPFEEGDVEVAWTQPVRARR